MTVRPMRMRSCMLLATASSAVMSAVAYLATVAPSREWNTQNGGVRPPVFFYTVVFGVRAVSSVPVAVAKMTL